MVASWRRKWLRMSWHLWFSSTSPPFTLAYPWTLSSSYLVLRYCALSWLTHLTATVLSPACDLIDVFHLFLFIGTASFEKPFLVSGTLYLLGQLDHAE